MVDNKANMEAGKNATREMEASSIAKRAYIRNPGKIGFYFRQEKWVLLIVTISGITYNVGMVAGPWFEGQLVQRLFDIIQGRKQFQDMVFLAILYVVVILFVQLVRYMKRLYVRKFANHVNRDMKQILYSGILQKSKLELEAEGTGNLMTKAVSDINLCSEGMRKFTTEIFDTGVVMIAYMGMLLYYDWRLALLSALFPPIAYVIAEKLKKKVTKNVSAYKESAGKLNSATMDRVSNAITYRVFGQEQHQNELYDQHLVDYEKKAIWANIWENAMQPLYRIISMMSVVFILLFGVANVLGRGWTVWNIAAFTTFLSCFTKLATKSSKAAKLFNAVQKASVSWKRIRPFMVREQETNWQNTVKPAPLTAHELAFRYAEEDGLKGEYLFEHVAFKAKPGEMIGITGPVACGKTTFGKLFLGELEYEGVLSFGNQELKALYRNENRGVVGYMGHQPQLLSSTIEDNILLGEDGDVWPYLRAVCIEEEIRQMPSDIHTLIGDGGVRLSGGQQTRIELARSLYHRRPIIILDDPFSAVDQRTEKEIIVNLKEFAKDSIVFLISHRLSVFPELSQVFWMEKGLIHVADHKQLMEQYSDYRQLYQLQMGGDRHEA
ncbi:MAG TPA: ABC transporter ATP-binding protein [Lachnospiraceae bacterium]|nr:ABC transporter ATP-binding protein [Lachnospiraceae bacterium]